MTYLSQYIRCSCITLVCILVTTSCSWTENSNKRINIQNTNSDTQKKIRTLYTGHISGYDPFQTGPIEPPINSWIANGGIKHNLEGPDYNNPMDFWKSESTFIESIQSGAELIIAYEKGYYPLISLSGTGNIQTENDEEIPNTINVYNGEGLYWLTGAIGKNNFNYLWIKFPVGIKIYSIDLR